AVNLLDVAATPASTLRRKLGLLALQCHKIGRPLSDLDVSATLRTRPDATADDLAAGCRHLAGLGITHAVLAPAGPWTPGAMKALADAAPAIRAMDGSAPGGAEPPVGPSASPDPLDPLDPLDPADEDLDPTAARV